MHHCKRNGQACFVAVWSLISSLCVTKSGTKEFSPISSQTHYHQSKWPHNPFDLQCFGLSALSVLSLDCTPQKTFPSALWAFNVLTQFCSVHCCWFQDVCSDGLRSLCQPLSRIFNWKGCCHFRVHKSMTRCGFHKSMKGMWEEEKWNFLINPSISIKLSENPKVLSWILNHIWLGNCSSPSMGCPNEASLIVCFPSPLTSRKVHTTCETRRLMKRPKMPRHSSKQVNNEMYLSLTKTTIFYLDII